MHKHPLAFRRLCTGLILAAAASAALSSGQAMARNHDIQAIRLPSPALAHHDRAPSPAGRT